MRVKFGRNNAAVTVYFPKDCHNHCAFCPSKQQYEEPCNIQRVLHKVEQWNRTHIPEFVITGGEPMTDLDLLRKILDKIGSNKSVYINTTFLKQNCEEFIDIVNSSRKIKGVNISRHCVTYEMDQMMLDGIAEDEMIFRLNKPVKINVLLGEQATPVLFAYLERWNKPGVTVCFREDFRTLDAGQLHDPYFKNATTLASFGRFVNHSQCNVCDTVLFETEHGQQYQYHRGLYKSSILDANQSTLEVNDIVIFPNGDSGYDWDGTRTYMDEVWTKARRGNLCSFAVILATPPDAVQHVDTTPMDYEYTRPPYCGRLIGGLSCGFPHC